MDQRRKNKAPDGRWKSEKRLLIICAEIFALVILVGTAAIFLLEDHSRYVESSQKRIVENAEILLESSVSVEAEEPDTQEEPKRYDDILADRDYCDENRIYAKDTISSEEVSLLFAGDISFAEGYANMYSLMERGGDIKNCFDEDIMNVMQNADIFMVNNEFPYTDRGTPTEDKLFTFRAKVESVKYLYDLGVDIVSIANNHVYDYGEESLLDTLSTLENASIPYVGAGINKQEAIKPVYFIANDIKIAYLSATQIERLDNPDTKGASQDAPGVFRCWNDDTILTSVKEAKGNSDFVVVYIHWGTETQETPDWAQEKQAKELAEAGADLIIGDHTHCLQGITYIGETPVFYSLGNYWFNSKTMDNCLVRIQLTQQGIKSVQFLPARQENCRTVLLKGEEAKRVIDYMNDLSGTAVIDAEGYVKKTLDN